MRKDHLTFRTAEHHDLPAIVRLLADDPLGAAREKVEDPLPEGYLRAFQAIQQDPHHDLLVVVEDDVVLGVLQLTLLPNLTYQGSWRAQIEGVRVSEEARGRGMGRLLIEEAIDRARRAGCRLVQLTTDKQRPAALRFYESLGFVASHVGMKMRLISPSERS